VIGVQQIDQIVSVVEETLKGNSVRMMGTKKKDQKKYGGASLSLPKVRRNPLIEIIAINTGFAYFQCFHSWHNFQANLFNMKIKK
jgi:threonylcarbamoyladenosine tRNA methylthiotransferase CDKAL1